MNKSSLYRELLPNSTSYKLLYGAQLHGGRVGDFSAGSHVDIGTLSLLLMQMRGEDCKFLSCPIEPVLTCPGASSCILAGTFKNLMFPSKRSLRSWVQLRWFQACSQICETEWVGVASAEGPEIGLHVLLAPQVN